jgi:hypothetical protein
MPSYSVNDSGVAHARRLIEARQYVLESSWGDVQPRADAENASSSHIRGMTTRNGTSGSRTGPRMRPRRGTRSYTETSVGSTEWA